MDALKPLCGREGLVVPPDPSVTKTVCSLVCSFLQEGKKGAPAGFLQCPACSWYTAGAGRVCTWKSHFCELLVSELLPAACLCRS